MVIESVNMFTLLTPKLLLPKSTLIFGDQDQDGKCLPMERRCVAILALRATYFSLFLLPFLSDLYDRQALIRQRKITYITGR